MLRWPAQYAVAFGSLCVLGMLIRGTILGGPELALFVCGLAATIWVSVGNEVLPVGMPMRNFVLGFSWPFVFFVCGKFWYWIGDGVFPGYGEYEVPIVALMCVAAGCCAHWGFKPSASDRHSF